MTVAVWLGRAAPVRSVRWLDGALGAAAKFGDATAIAAGDPAWLDLAADRARRAGVAFVGIPTELELDYLGWAQIVAAASRQLGAATIVVDEASRPERPAEVGAIAELLGAAQLTHVVELAPDGVVVHASRVQGGELQTVRVRGAAVFGVRIAGAPIDEHPTPLPAPAMRLIELTALGLDPGVLGHRAQLPRATAAPRKSVERIAEYLAAHVTVQPTREGR